MSNEQTMPGADRSTTPAPDELALYDYHLPEELIARHPAPRREDARLLVLDRETGEIAHRKIGDLPSLLNAGDCLVLNDTRVLKARLLGRRRRTGARWEGLFLEATPDGHWSLLSQTRGKLQPGEFIVVSPAHAPHSTDELRLELVDRDAEGTWTVRPMQSGEPAILLERFGTVPLPPYMKRQLAESADFERYQTEFARHPGSVAAPTAGLHFTTDLFDRCGGAGIGHAFVTLHVGIGTFRPITAARLADHRMHSEWCELPSETAQTLNRVRLARGRVVAVGTTSTRTLESAARANCTAGWRGSTDLFIRPPFEFRAVDALLTNFHLPRSSLLVLVSAFAGREAILAAYAAAIREQYRFYSYGDAMLIYSRSP
jgi:S-adenosylmethionine:tRNA ribosyltransferase-isomerase